MLKKTSPLAVKIFYIALQGIFLPLILRLDDAVGAHYWMLFTLYEALVIGDALLYWAVFHSEKDR